MWILILWAMTSNGVAQSYIPNFKSEKECKDAYYNAKRATDNARWSPFVTGICIWQTK